MNRRKFLNLLGGGTIGSLLAPLVEKQLPWNKGKYFDGKIEQATVWDVASTEGGRTTWSIYTMTQKGKWVRIAEGACAGEPIYLSGDGGYYYARATVQ